MSLLLLTCYPQMIQAQTTDFYSLESAYQQPAKVKALILNLNFQALSSLPANLDILKNLEELILFPSLEKLSGGTAYPALEDSVDSAFHPSSPVGKGITSLPESIGKLFKLKKVDVQNNPIQALPTCFNELSNLEELRLDQTQINFDVELPKLLALPHLKLVSILGCQASQSALNRFREAHPQTELITNLADAQKYYQRQHSNQKEVLIELVFHDTYFTLYVNDQESERFLKSLPLEYQRNISQQIKANKQKSKAQHSK